MTRMADLLAKYFMLLAYLLCSITTYGVEVADVGTGDVSFSTPSLADVRRNLEITEIQKPENQTQQLIVEYIYLPEGCDDIKSREDKQNLVWDDRDEYLSDPYDKKKIEESKAATKLLRRRAKSQLGDVLVIHYTAFIDESSTEGSKGSLVDTTYNEFKREHRHDLMGHKHSNRPGKPFEFTLGRDEGHKIKLQAFDLGLVGMCVGERRQLIVPPHLGFGPLGSGPHTVRRSFPPVPGGATLKYIVKLVAIREPTLNEVLLRSDGRMDGQGERISPDMEEAYEKFVKGSAVGKNIFADIDLDKDLRITHEELVEWYEAQKARARDDGSEPAHPMAGSSKRREKRGYRSGSKIFRHLPQHFWDSQDKDKDGFISWEEFPGPKGTKEDPFKSEL